MVHFLQQKRWHVVPELSRRRLLKAIGAVVLAGALTGCAGMDFRNKIVDPELYSKKDSEIDLAKAAAENTNRMVLEKFANSLRVVDDPWGFKTVEMFIQENGSDSLIIAENSDGPLLRAASLAVAQHVPMLIFDDSMRSQVSHTIDSLGATRVVLIGDVEVATTSGDVEIFQDPGTTRAMGEMTAFQFTSRVVGKPEQMVEAISHLNGTDYVELKSAWEPVERIEGLEVLPIPAQSRRDSEMSPFVIATPETSVAAVTNSMVFGAQVRVMPTPDPRDSKAQMAQVAGLADGPLIALGAQFGDEELLSDRIKDGWDDKLSSPRKLHPTDNSDS